jgi:hypothetical protein
MGLSARKSPVRVMPPQSSRSSPAAPRPFRRVETASCGSSLTGVRPADCRGLRYGELVVVITDEGRGTVPSPRQPRLSLGLPSSADWPMDARAATRSRQTPASDELRASVRTFCSLSPCFERPAVALLPTQIASSRRGVGASRLPRWRSSWTFDRFWSDRDCSQPRYGARPRVFSPAAR